MTDRAPKTEAALFRQIWDADIRGLVVRSFKWVLTLGLVGTIVAAGVGMWRYSDQIFDERFVVHNERPFERATVSSIGGVTVTLAFDSGPGSVLMRDGLFGVRWPGGSGTLGDVVASADGLVTREFIPTAGALSEGRVVSVDPIVFHTDPAQAFGLEFEPVSLGGSAGALPAWFVPGTDPTWVIFVHSRGSGPEDGLRLLPEIAALGHPTVLMEYRNHGDAGDDPSGVYRYGLTEADDVEDAVRYALAEGAEDVVLIGHDMGGSAILEFFDRSPFVVRVSGAILDSPILDVGRSVILEASDAGVPDFLVRGAQTIAAMRFGVRWSETNFVAKLDEVPVPVLLINGDENPQLPPKLADEFADRFPSVDVVEIDGAGHMEGWNVATAEYVAAVAAFFDRLDDPPRTQPDA